MTLFGCDKKHEHGKNLQVFLYLNILYLLKEIKKFYK
jgi:hypothetical protein